ncbi:MAG: O-antigen ligase family protein [Muribaculaceae bacterium]|nr:O-antigen ligase family protein [Muribaculaceae bacterium]
MQNDRYSIKDWVILFSSAIVTFLLLIAGIAEAGYGLLQLLGICPSRHHLYPVTGSFYNPGPFGCYLSFTVPLAIAEFCYGKRPLLRYTAVTLLLLDALMLPVSMSRTAWIASALGTLTVFSPKIIRFFRSSPRLYTLLAVAGLSASLWGVYSIKADSADGRLLMWKVAVRAVSPSPFSGTGAQCVAGAYGVAQEEYFASGQGSEREMMVADAPEYVFNEYLQTAIAYGWGSALLLIIVLIAALCTALSCRNLAIAGCVAAVMTVMAASYPFQFPISTATIALILIAAFFSTTMIDVRLAGAVASALLCLFLCHPFDRMEVSRKFNVGLVLHKSGKWEESNKVLAEMLPYSSDPMPLNIIGKNFQQLNLPDSAEHYLTRAAFRCPNRLYPHYLLMHLYADPRHPQKEKAMREARLILSKEVKIKSPAADDIRREAKELLNDLSNEIPSAPEKDI